MRWQNRERSSNVDDRRRRRARRVGGSVGIGTILIAVVALLFGEDPQRILESLQGGQAPGTTTTAPAPSAEEDQLAEFVKVVLKDTEDVWNRLFREELGQAYREPVLVLYSDAVRSACGFAQAATGPFYCPADQKIYIDLSFYQELKTRFRAPGDFAMAYIVAHETAHHVQNLLGITRQVSQQQRRVSKVDANKLSVRLELQADFLAGVWAHHAQRTKQILEEGDIEEALRAAAAVGDDRIQKQSRGYIVPDAFTHGTSEQRMRWFAKGLKTGDLSQGDTFAAESL